ncbi:hypothetical protein ACROYT_G026611 [Oculina patagonica]
MKVVSVASVVFLVTCAVSGNSAQKGRRLEELRNLDGEKLERAVFENYKPVGCYSLKKLRKLKIFGKESYKKTRVTSATPFDQCIPEAKENNYEIIGIQKIKKSIICRKGNEKQWKPDAAIKKLNPKKCKNDVGSKRSIFIYRRSQSQNPGTCSANNKVYHDGDEIVFHNVTSPIEDAACTSCRCSSGSITDCLFTYCDIGLRDFPPEVCDNWITGQEGVCCPRCEACITNADPWTAYRVVNVPASLNQSLESVAPNVLQHPNRQPQDQFLRSS